MKAGLTMVRASRIGLSFVLLVSFQSSVVMARGNNNNNNNNGSNSSNSGLLPIERSYINPDLVNVLFPIDQPSNNNNGNGNNNGNNNSNNSNGNNSGNNNGNNNNNNNNNGNNRNGNNGNSNNNNNGNNNGNNNNGNNNNRSQNDSQTMNRALVVDEFRCNIFENAPYEDILSAVNALNQAVSSPSCGGSGSKIDVKGIVDNNKKVSDAVTALKGFVENPDTVHTENAADIVNNVDVAIRAANSLATSFAQSDLMNDQCRKQMNGGQIASAIGDIMNGLTPYALMAAQLTGGTAAIPFIVGGSIATTAISSMGKIIEENSVKIYDSQVRRAIVENTCQFIRLDQKYKFLIKSRSEQMKQITADITASQKLFSVELKGVSGETQNLVNRKKFLDQVSLKMKDGLTEAQNQLELDKQFLKGTSDEIKICQLGIQMAAMAQQKTSYVASLLGSLDEAMAAYGTTNVAQAQALKSSADFAAQSLIAMNQKQFNVNTKFANCAKVTKSFVESIDRAGSFSKELVKSAQLDIDKRVKGSQDYGFLSQRLDNLSAKQVQAERVSGSLENLRKSATKITQSEIDSEMERLRRGLLSPRTLGIASPVMKWFNYVRGLHEADIAQFKIGLDQLRTRAFSFTSSGSVQNLTKASFLGAKSSNIKDQDDAFQLRPFNLVTLPLGTRDHDDACREMQDIWGRWVMAVDHLMAMDSFCRMIEPYIYDNRSEDKDLVATCRGFTVASGGAYGAAVSTVEKLQNQLINTKTRDWALYLDKKIQGMVCMDQAAEGNLK